MHDTQHAIAGIKTTRYGFALCTSGEKDTDRGKFAAKERNNKKPTSIWHIPIKSERAKFLPSLS